MPVTFERAHIGGLRVCISTLYVCFDCVIGIIRIRLFLLSVSNSLLLLPHLDQALDASCFTFPDLRFYLLFLSDFYKFKFGSVCLSENR